jgi:hypothetical protein
MTVQTVVKQRVEQRLLHHVVLKYGDIVFKPDKGVRMQHAVEVR